MIRDNNMKDKILVDKVAYVQFESELERLKNLLEANVVTQNEAFKSPVGKAIYLKPINSINSYFVNETKIEIEILERINC